MNSKRPISDQKALVVVFDDTETANKVAEKLLEQGCPRDRIEIVNRDVRSQAPEIETPLVHETTTSSLIGSAGKWGGIGAGAGALVGLLLPVPGFLLGMIAIGGLAGAAVGGVAGIERASDDDSVDLPSLDDYAELVEAGDTLLVILGTHEEVMGTEQKIKELYEVRSHIHSVYGHAFHEHPVGEHP